MKESVQMFCNVLLIILCIVSFWQYKALEETHNAIHNLNKFYEKDQMIIQMLRLKYEPEDWMNSY